jgi:phage I-like protein
MKMVELSVESLAEAFRDFNEKQRQKAADSGAAMPDGSFPIETEQDLRNAIHAIGRAKDPAAAKAHIKKRAAALGRADLVPEGWSVEFTAWGATIELEPFEAQPGADGLVPGKPIQLFKLGKYKARDGRKLNVAKEETDSLLADAQVLSDDGNEIALLAEHGEDPVEGMKALGWIDPSSIELRAGSGLWATRPKWTTDAYSDIKARKRRYISPHVFSVIDADGAVRPRRWLEITATNIPAITGMASIAAHATRSTDSPEDEARERKERAMQNVAKLLGLAETASEDDISKATTALTAKVTDLETKLAAKTAGGGGGHNDHGKGTCSTECPCNGTEKLTAKPEPDAALAAVAKTVAAQLGPIFIEQFAAAAKATAEKVVTERFAAEAKEKRVAALVDRGAREGKIIKADREKFAALAAIDPESFEKVVLPALKVVAPVRTLPIDRSDTNLDTKDPAEEGALLMTHAAQLSATTGVPLADVVDYLRTKPDGDGAPKGKEN